MGEVAEAARVTLRAKALSLALLAVVAVAGTGIRWWDPWDSRATFDTLQYARVAYQFEGKSRPDALTSAVRLRCHEWARVHAAPGWVPVSTPSPASAYAAQCVRPGYVPGVNPKYESIFAARPGYPLTVVALAPVLGDGAFAAVALASAALTVFLAGVAALLLGLGRWPAILAAVGVIVLPTGLYLTRLGPDGLVGVGVCAAVCGALLAVRHQRLGWSAGVLSAGLLLLFSVKQPVAVALGAALAVSAAWGARRPGPSRRPAALVAAVSAAGAWAAVLAGAALGWAGLETTVQDLATAHFVRPAVAHPYRHLVYADGVLLTDSGPGHPGVYVVLALAAVALVALVRRGLSGWLVVAAGTSGLLLVAVHPVATEAARLALPMWLAVALGLAAAAERIPRRRSG